MLTRQNVNNDSPLDFRIETVWPDYFKAGSFHCEENPMLPWGSFRCEENRMLPWNSPLWKIPPNVA